MKVLILGASGMLGRMLHRVLSADPGLELHATVRNPNFGFAHLPRMIVHQIDALHSEPEDWRRLFLGFDWIINAIGIIKQRINESNPSDQREAFFINILLPYRLAFWAEEAGARVLQIATDCVFSGDAPPYAEDSEHDAEDVYGKTKSLGEVHAAHVHHLRCSIIGPNPDDSRSLMEWFLQQPPGARVAGFTNYFWNGLTTYHFARTCQGIIREGIPLPHVQHVVPTGSVSKCALLQNLRRLFGREDIEILPTEAPKRTDRTLVTLNPELNFTLWRAAGYLRPPTILEMVEELAAFMEVSPARS